MLSTHSTLETFIPWIQQTDPHAGHRLDLLAEARRLLAEAPAPSSRSRLALAARLERWRYQLLNEHAGNPAPEDRALSDAIGLAANQLAGRPPRMPRSARAAIQDASLDEGGVARGMACLDPAVPLEEIARRAAELTREHFAPRRPTQTPLPFWRMLLYAPLYLSNHCINYCTYCGFRYPQRIQRRHLDLQEAIQQAEILRGRGFDHLLLVGGDFPSLTTTAYYAEILRCLAGRGVEPAVEIAPQSTQSYAELAGAGAGGVTLYQETYDEQAYACHHPRGSKASYDWRLEGLERAAEAGIHRLGLGILLGLADPRQDLRRLLRHARYLADRFPDCRLAFSLPRIHEAPQGFRAPFLVDDETFLRMYCALRIAFPQATLVLSTREPVSLRNRLARICITQLSAGSSTAPGGYGDSPHHHAGQQFPVCDGRTPAEVAHWLRGAGFELTWRHGTR